ncbi:MAG: TIGR02647 family protein [Candidatus Dactylopiibacterium carminicum]|uniref:TIGR02647 family protein n=1 Tax=Candidatus Dactylopiibacterium carminicum TaxID=857335 RepID=A0A272EWD1_9RHOO|nr:TIGR02647 family protein [Candidatus Dactylopiibacterium carminicum]KAF7599990.1 TIGR02647 family protein [Candidatus Dactylopiibacterium carminicum]PAS94427.1 MAG: TIGR02647 family protein [Candidatus Dactylopiibacterium carminicum]PAS96410.1 MAG: TIGR02647 family protein [Candidatus Dactylopiibacterium carminicum]PAS99993.1 MAG: TIGR02647 family protein [Candidatus Dactylopiibacterium carminicum]
MGFTAEQLDELNALLRFDLDTSQQGLKIHSNADAQVIAATTRLHARGLITQRDGGYLTPLGRDAAEQAQLLLSIFSTQPAHAQPA